MTLIKYFTQNNHSAVRAHKATGSARDFIHELGFPTAVTLNPSQDNRSPAVTALQNTGK